MIFGIICAFVGGTLFTLLQTGTLQITAAGAGLTLPDILVAVLGAIATIYLRGLIRISSNTYIADWQLSKKEITTVFYQSSSSRV